MQPPPPKFEVDSAEVSVEGNAGRGVISTRTDPAKAILRVLRDGERYLVCSHTRLDGDAVGSMLALGHLIEQMGKHADLVTADRVPLQYKNLPGADRIRTVEHVDGFYDAVILLECDSLQRARLQGLESFYQINIDHHVSGRQFANLNWIDDQAVSVGEMVHRLVQAAGAIITPELATCLYVTILTDTGGFCYGSIGESTFALARHLVLAGADPVAIAKDVYYSSPASKMLLLGTALSRVKREGRVAWLYVTHRDMVNTCAIDEDSDGIVNFAIAVEGVEAAFFLRELPEGRVRVSLRSKGAVNVAAIAEHFGGGGHESSAGCTLDGPILRACDQILEPLQAALAGFSGAPARA
jgi:bifunctional oligoribonuclease and PAP phosphatase NrnA